MSTEFTTNSSKQGDAVFAPIEIRVEDLWIVKGGGLFSSPKSIVQGATFSIEPGQFVAVIGPNGAGKTTLFKSFIGEKPVRGNILLYRANGQQTDFEDFYDNPEFWMQQIGYIPVDNILHDDLTVRQALMHVGKLRLPKLSDKEVFEKIQNTIERLGFARNDYRLDQFVSTLSSGERKKLNISAELLTDPPLLLLDEPTSNLDPNAERDLMNSLKSLSGSNTNGQGPTILLITHTLETLDRCDKVIFVENSRLVADGPEEAVFEDLMIRAGDEVSNNPKKDLYIPLHRDNHFEDWAFIFDVFKTDEKRAKRQEINPPPKQHRNAVARRDIGTDSFWRQFAILSNRYFLLRLNDLNGMFAILFSGFIAGFLLLIAPSEIFLKADDATAARQTVVLYTILVVIMGAFNSHREISKEFRIYLHERTKGLKPLAYIMSKGIWLTAMIGVFSTNIILALSGFPIARVFVIVAGFVIMGVGVWHTYLTGTGRLLSSLDKTKRIFRLLLVISPLFLASLVQLQNKELPDFPINVVTVEIMFSITLILTAIAAVFAGLMGSSIVGNNNDRATQIVIGLIIFNVILAFSVLVVGAAEFRGLFDTLEPYSASYWGYSGISSSLSIYCWAGRPVIENFNSIGHIFAMWLYLLVHIVVAIALAVVALRLQETWTTRRRTLMSMVDPRREGLNLVAVGVVVVLLSWAVFLNGTSQRYFELTYFDRLFGANRYAKIENLDVNLTLNQQVFGMLSSSPCRIGEGTEDDVELDPNSSVKKTMPHDET